MLETALDYARRGWPVLVLKPRQKLPITTHGLKDATTDPAVIRAWWDRWPKANVGLLTGVAFDVLDLDSDDALERLFDQAPRQGGDVNGPAVKTGNGWHCYLAPTGLGNTVRIGGLDGVDWRGAGGYVVAPPSLHPNGSTYRWVDIERPIEPPPSWLVALLRPPRPQIADLAPVPQGKTAYGRRALESECGRVAMAPMGQRNDTLNRAAHAMGRLIPTGAVDIDEVVAALTAVALRAGLGEAEARRTIASGLNAGVRNPRQVT